jgi:hypothetical protein
LADQPGPGPLLANVSGPDLLTGPVPSWRVPTERSRIKFAGIRSVKQSVPSQLQFVCSDASPSKSDFFVSWCLGGVSIAGLIDLRGADGMCPDRTFRPVPSAVRVSGPSRSKGKFAGFSSVKQRVPSRRWSKVPQSKVQSRNCEPQIFELGLDLGLPSSPVPFFSRPNGARQL